MNPTTLAAIGIGSSIAIFTFGVIFKLGHHSARLEALEEWKKTIRADMHEISDILTDLRTDIKEVRTLIEERTERREKVR